MVFAFVPGHPPLEEWVQRQRAGHDLAERDAVQEVLPGDPAALLDQVALHGSRPRRSARRTPACSAAGNTAGTHRIPRAPGWLASSSCRPTAGRWVILPGRRGWTAQQWIAHLSSRSGGFQSAQDNIQARGFGGVVASVVQVGLVHDGGDPPQHRVGQVVAAQDRLEAAITAMMGQLRTRDVERGGAGGDVGRVTDEEELRPFVNVAADQPGAGRPVNVDARPGSPPHAGSSSAWRAGTPGWSAGWTGGAPAAPG